MHLFVKENKNVQQSLSIMRLKVEQKKEKRKKTNSTMDETLGSQGLRAPLPEFAERKLSDLCGVSCDPLRALQRKLTYQQNSSGSASLSNFLIIPALFMIIEEDSAATSIDGKAGGVRSTSVVQRSVVISPEEGAVTKRE